MIVTFFENLNNMTLSKALIATAIIMAIIFGGLYLINPSIINQ